jgi:heme-degrading monooxygenase HmoA
MTPTTPVRSACSSGRSVADRRDQRLIARTWRGVTRSTDADRYERYVADTGMAESRQTPGNRGFLLFRREAGSETEFLTLSLWESMDAVRRFAGEDAGRARFYPEDEAFLVRKDLHTDHFELVVADHSLPSRPTEA